MLLSLKKDHERVALGQRYLSLSPLCFDISFCPHPQFRAQHSSSSGNVSNNIYRGLVARSILHPQDSLCQSAARSAVGKAHHDPGFYSFREKVM
jgi:hypothetical protein